MALKEAVEYGEVRALCVGVDGEAIQMLVKVARAFPKMLSALEAVEMRLKACARSRPGSHSPEEVVAKVGDVPIDAVILRSLLIALRAAREAVKP